MLVRLGIPLALCVVVDIVGCSGDVAPQTITFTAQAGGGGVAHGVVDNEHGWRVTLTEAHACLGLVELHAGEAVLASWFDTIFSFSQAHAHPGHYDAGGLVGEVDGAVDVDLIADEPTSLATGNGLSGHAGSASVHFAGTCSGDLAGHALVLAGVAEKGGATKHFKTVQDVPDAPVDGIAVDVELAQDDTLLVQQKLSELVGRVDFALVDDGSADAPSVFVPNTQAHNAVGRGMRNAGSFLFSKQ